MKSNVAVTYQIDDLEAAAAELWEGVSDNFTFGRNSAGILFCYSDTEISELAELLRAKTGFDILGCTGIATMDSVDGFHEMAATFMVLTADDCELAVLRSDVVTRENVAEQVGQLYEQAKTSLGAQPKLLFALPPYRLEIMLDQYAEAFNTMTPGIPVVGGLPSNHSNGDYNLTIYNGETQDDRMVILAISGNIRPVSAIKHVSVNAVVRKRKVTEAEGNTVYKVGDQNFVDYLREVGLPVEKLVEGTSTITFVSNPLLLENTNPNDDSFSFVRTLHEIDLEKGSGTAVGRIPQGATISICALKRDEIEAAAADAITALTDKIQPAIGEGYAYSTILAVSCIGRYLLMLPKGEVEVNQILAQMPKGMALSGFYSYGEIGPMGNDASQTFAHNESLVLCAF